MTISYGPRRNVNLQLNKDQNRDTVILNTDLLLAFDTCQHLLLLAKLDHLGIRIKEMSLMESYLINCKIYIEVQGYNSIVKNLGQTSVVQGSELSGLLYTIYTWNIGQLNRLMEDNNKF